MKVSRRKKIWQGHETLRFWREENVSQSASHLHFSAGALLEKVLMEVKYHVKRPRLGETPPEIALAREMGGYRRLLAS